ncbi:radical SAM protein [Candidatus Gracilibacteria bacterium]|nr:radical SAM protein [Candidatus Gracilibacteria bacterium]
MKYNIILNLTTKCNYKCSYCDIHKTNEEIDDSKLDEIYNFIKTNYKYIDGIKFFGGEPILKFDIIKKIINYSEKYIGRKFTIVTNASILNDEIGIYLYKYFDKIFFSIDSENKFEYEKIFNFSNKHNLKKKLYFNLMINPGEENISYIQFNNLLKYGFNNFNILPVYYTKNWNKDNLINLSLNVKKIIDESMINKSIKLYGFNENKGYNSSLINENLFIDTDIKLYYSDLVSLNLGRKLKDYMFLGELNSTNLETISFDKQLLILREFEKHIVNNNDSQIQLHSIMDYFSKYINKKKDND